MKQTPFEEGVRAQTEGIERSSNPYGGWSKEWVAWENGWLEANNGDDCENRAKGDE